MPFNDRDAAPSPPQAPPRAGHTNLPADEPVWASARRLYKGRPVVHRGGGAPQPARAHRAAPCRQRGLAHPACPTRRRRREVAWADAVDDHGAAFVETMLVDRLAALLVHPSGEALVREAAHLAAEAVAERRLQETLLWLRAVREAERVSGRIDWAPAGPRPGRRLPRHLPARPGRRAGALRGRGRTSRSLRTEAATGTPPLHLVAWIARSDRPGAGCGPRAPMLDRAHARRPVPHPKFFHRRTHRPRQVHAVGSLDPADGRAFCAGDEGTGFGFDGDRARARDHHQGADRAARLPRGRRARLCAEPDRHARPRGLRLRGLAQPRRLRGQPARGRRLPGRGGADAGQRLPSHRGQPRDRARAQQGRPPRRRRGPRQGADRGGDRHRRVGRRAGQRQDGPWHRRDAGGHRHPPPRPQGRPRGPPQGAPRRRLVRRLPGRGRARPRVRRRAQGRPAGCA